jgi:hypothetical protein
MTLRVIGAGFGRTGTDSMRQALEMLGFGPCHHMREVMAKPEQRALWRAVAAGAAPDWDHIFKGYVSAVDWPSAFYWRELSRHYPDAKMLLTVRSSESWYESMTMTIFKGISKDDDPASLGIQLITKRVFDDRIDDRDHVIATYEKNNAEVKAAFGPERLLAFEIGDGWGPLCRFLGVAIPDAPYPHANSTAAFRSEFVQAQR